MKSEFLEKQKKIKQAISKSPTKRKDSDDENEDVPSEKISEEENEDIKAEPPFP